ncbi:PREDICTED: uncharacterized protein LOC107072322 [Polistes dominula]|uniref:Uncharacterized protein LOC107072322 n=1 Tax=Polistes dominula TaxID=743375 RepID=A0ABM1J596_POLDO|nr:PREDICTED: uncharacterized protein LOC107072322 [Polistes dominula]XP_015187632.1 PREDICTED: uncharacterized protein LOC107072322 [Polistes dominula]XP_015187633.1 PREDICTED: uncharacterized protein LOC107072322 [Polistes dominula]XP_015187634.1 PREDICTED: uncharacterized protein LOC107072322 [Polistes dominula]
MRNVEIKTKINDSKTFIEKLEKITDTEMIVIKQLDTFFESKTGRLKLRRFEDATGELIYYERPDTTGPKLSDYKKIDLNAKTYEDMNKILSVTNGIIGTVKKTRRLYTIDQTRIHVDDVHDLGSFLELEVILKDNQDVDYGTKVAENIMKNLNIDATNLISIAYIDLLNKTKNSE